VTTPNENFQQPIPEMKHSPSAVDCYLNGTMSAQEQTEFAAQVAADPALRATLEAEQVIRNTVRNDLAAFPAEHALTRSRVMESLAAVKTPAGIAAGGGGAWYASGALLKGVLGAIVLAGLSVGGYLWMEQQSSTGEPVSPVAAPVVTAPSAVPESSSVATSATEVPAPENVAPLAKESNGAAPAQRKQSVATEINRGNTPSRSSDAGVPHNVATPQPQATTEEPASQATRPAATARQLRVVNKDSVKLKVQVKVK